MALWSGRQELYTRVGLLGSYGTHTQMSPNTQAVASSEAATKETTAWHNHNSSGLQIKGTQIYKQQSQYSKVKKDREINDHIGTMSREQMNLALYCKPFLYLN